MQAGQAVIREAEIGDLEQVGRLIRQSFDPMLRPYMVYAQHGAPDFLAAYIQYPSLASDRTLLVAPGDLGGIVGFAEFRHVAARPAHLSYICVDPTMRGRGLAEALIRHFVAHTPDVREIDLHVFAENTPAIALYRKLGLTEAGGTSWYARRLPPAAEVVAGGLSVSNLPMAMAGFERFGFCEFQMDWGGCGIRLGRIGPTVLRCFDAASFTEIEFLAHLAAVVPDAREALLIAQHHPGVGRCVSRSIRMIGTISSIDRKPYGKYH